ncbi:HesA/MoeB/ThiF family protein [Olivibacter sp. XZL3]|uniref:HesA/MoeB/ThiF family protein n=1 Tax=Olivibacter sp. XZL3 TaxID=1735116 RepID=UPI001F0EB742|nr:HesA/MoeB/ThiF family protein [Olivibacter sp. XZL3]
MNLKMEHKGLTERYQRQIQLKEFGVAGQLKLSQASVLVVGAGGLGCPALLYLAAAGVGKIGIVDDGLVEMSNLHRQVLYGTQDIGKKKVTCAKEVLQRMNDDIEIEVFAARVTSFNAFEIIAAYDIIIDGTDNFQSRYLINDACAILNKPLVYGAISRYEGQVSVFTSGINYRDIFPYPPKDGEVLNCSEAGVLNVLPGFIGNLLANECIKLITGIGEVLIGKLLVYNILSSYIYTIEISPTERSAQVRPLSKADFEQVDYPSLCGIEAPRQDEISADELNSLYSNREVDVVDVREDFELPKISHYTHIRIPLSSLHKEISVIKKDTVVFVCQSGKRSLLAAQRYRELISPQSKAVFSLKGGIASLEAGIKR